MGGGVERNAGVFPGPVFFNAPIYPAALATGNNNDYAPPGFASANVVCVTGDGLGTSVITGIAGGSPNRFVIFFNQGADSLTYASHSAASLAQNRIHCPGGVNLTVAGGAGTMMWWDSSHGHWRIGAWA